MADRFHADKANAVSFDGSMELSDDELEMVCGGLARPSSAQGENAIPALN